MRTELEIVPSAPVAGRKIAVLEYNIRNYRLHQVVEQMSRLFLFCVEADSNNTASKSRPRDVRRILSQWKIVKDEFEFSMSHNDFPNGSHEYAYKLYILDQKEVQRVRNVKIKRVVSEMWNAVQVLLSVDSANTQGFIAEEDAVDIRQMFVVVDDTLARWIGDGKDALSVGLTAPAYEELGEILPDVDGDYAQLLEPSSALPLSKLPDVADVGLDGK